MYKNQPLTPSNKQEQQKIRLIRIQRMKHIKQQQEKFSKILETRIDYNSKYIRKLISEGIPSRYRPHIWPQLMKNRHGITPQFYLMLVKKAAYYKQSNFINSNDQQSKIGTIKLIKQDIPRTFSQLKLFKDQTDLCSDLQEILEAWVIYRQDLGYIQGMSQIAGFLLTQLKDYESFNVFSSIITTPLLSNFYTFNMKQIEKFQKKFDHVFRINNQELFYHFKENQVQTRLYLFQWIVTIFTKCIQFQILGRLWDMILMYECNPNFLVEVAYGILQTNLKQIMKVPGDDILRYLKNIKVKIAQEAQLFDHLSLYQGN